MDALLIIDMQQAYFEELLQYDTSAMIERVNRVANTLREYGDQVIFIQHDGNGKEAVAPNTPGWEIYSGLIQSPKDKVVRKKLNDAFAQTHLITELTKLKVDRLVISGWATDFCVDSTVRSAISHGYETVVLQDCHTVMDRPHMKAQDVIRHHNWLWQNLITTSSPVKLLPAEQLIQAKGSANTTNTSLTR